MIERWLEIKMGKIEGSEAVLGCLDCDSACYTVLV